MTGLGETSDYRATQMLAGGIDAIKHLLIGEDPSHIEELWQRVFRNFTTINGRGFVAHLVSAVDVALWDIRDNALLNGRSIDGRTFCVGCEVPV